MWGEWGVQLFFVLSGFLITGILLKGRKPEHDWSHSKRQLRQFYVRRSLRIFPLFYLVLLLTALANIVPVRETLPWHMTYLSNVYFALKGSWAGPVSHFWSLAVEEQFYLCWPFLMLFLPSRYLLRSILAAIVLAQLYKIIGFMLGFNSIALRVITLSCLDALGIGALLAFSKYKNLEQFYKLGNSKAYNGLGLVLFFVWLGGSLTRPHPYLIGVIYNLITLTLFAWLIHQASIGFEGPVKQVLETKPIIYLGKISYGLYIYHNFMPFLVAMILRRLHMSSPQHKTSQFLLSATATILVASCSWLLVERPINDLKNRFDYDNVQKNQK